MKTTDILRVERIDRGKNTFLIRWQMTYLCNYSCDFCIQGDRAYHLEKAKHESAQIREKICENLIRFIEGTLIEKAERIELYLVGGEVTALKDFIPILERLIKANFPGEIKITITTNLSMSEDDCRKVAAILKGKKKRSLSLQCSYYADFAKEEEFFGKIKALTCRTRFRQALEKMKALKQRAFYQKVLLKLFYKENNLRIGIGYPLRNDDDYLQYLQFCDRHAEYKDVIHSIVIRDYKTSVSRSVKEKLKNSEEVDKKIKVTLKDGRVEYFSNNNNIGLILDEEPYFQPHGFLCDIGNRSMTIGPQGNMSRCVSSVDETLFGNICTQPPEFLPEKIRCQAKRCACAYYSLIENDLN